jgi:hypothetical protein
MVEEAKLAWALAQVADPHLNAAERNDIYVKIGVGETFSAIFSLITTVVHKRLTLAADLVTTFSTWLDAYVGSDSEPHLRQLIGQVKSRPLDHASPGPHLAARPPRPKPTPAGRSVTPCGQPSARG